jgi:hypothetical protein
MMGLMINDVLQYFWAWSSEHNCSQDANVIFVVPFPSSLSCSSMLFPSSFMLSLQADQALLNPIYEGDFSIIDIE